jgi:mannose-6-phosphate isomerase
MAIAVPRRVDKPWGNELIWALGDRICGKVITIDTGRRLSFQYHERKEEAVLVLTGLLRLHLEDDTGTITTRDMGPGESAHVPVGRKHRFEALERVELVEVSTPELDDVVRLRDLYGREGTNRP